MVAYSWGGSYNSTSSYSSYSNNFIYQDGIGMPTTNLAANGNRPIQVSGIGAGYQSGASGMYVNINYSGSGNVGSGTWATSGGTFRFVLGYSSGTMYFGRNTGDTSYPAAVDAGDGTSFGAGAVPGSFSYYGVPTVPQAPASSSPAAGSMTVTWTAPADNGGSAITGYRVQVATNSSFSIGLVTQDLGVVLTTTITGLTAGATYYYRIFAKNAVSTATSTTGVQTTTATQVIKAAIHLWSGSAEYSTTTISRWTGSAETPVTTLVRWNGTAEVALS